MLIRNNVDEHRITIRYGFEFIALLESIGHCITITGFIGQSQPINSNLPINTKWYLKMQLKKNRDHSIRRADVYSESNVMIAQSISNVSWFTTFPVLRKIITLVARSKGQLQRMDNMNFISCCQYLLRKTNTNRLR